jgi:hypothetical protein
MRSSILFLHFRLVVEMHPLHYSLPFCRSGRFRGQVVEYSANSGNCQNLGNHSGDNLKRDEFTNLGRPNTYYFLSTHLCRYVSPRQRWQTGHKVLRLERPEHHRPLERGRPLDDRPIKVKREEHDGHLAHVLRAASLREDPSGHVVGLADRGQHVRGQEGWGDVQDCKKIGALLEHVLLCFQLNSYSGARPCRQRRSRSC